MLFKRNYTKPSGVLKKYFSFRNEKATLQPLAELMRNIGNEDFQELLEFLKNSPEISKNFSDYLKNIFSERPFNLSLTEANILSENAFFPEFKKRLLNKILPPVENENTVWYLVDTISVTPKKDLQQLHNIPEHRMDELFRILEISDFIKNDFVKNELLFSVNILVWRVIGSAMDVEVVNMVPNYRNFDNPFLALQNEIDELNLRFKEDQNFQLTSKDALYKQIKIYLDHCKEFVENAFKNSSIYGISGKINQELLKMKQQLQRISNVLWLLVIDDEEDDVRKSKLLVFDILEYKSHKNNLKELVDDSSLLLSHLITNHTADTGKHYITSSYTDYMKMFRKALGCGIVVGALCVLKMLYSYLPGSEFSHAILYAFNYAMGFVMIYLMGFVLATKQPAMTAATMAKVLSEEENSEKTYTEFAHLVSRLFRSQFIAFVGNVLLSFPTALLIIYGLDVIFNTNMAANNADKLLHDLDPIESKAIFHACIAGFFLFVSGIISGNIGNNSVYYRIPKRIAKNTVITTVFGKNFAHRLSEYYAKHWPGIVSNIWFGIFMGITAPIGKFLGLDLDIRHITFASGNFALGLYGKDFSVSTSLMLTCFVTVFLIGFFNFLVSFGLSMLLAFRSRKVGFGNVRKISKEIFRYFLKNPMKFFFPIRSYLDSRTKEMVEKASITKPEDR